MKGGKKKNNDTYVKLLPVITALAGVILGALLQHHLNMQTQQTLIKEKNQRQLFTQVWTLKNKLASKAKNLENIHREYLYLGAQMPFNTPSSAFNNYVYNKLLELRQEYFILNSEYNDLLDEAWDIGGKIQVHFTNIGPGFIYQWTDVLLNWPQVSEPPNDRKKLDEWYQEEENVSDEYCKNVFRPFVRELLSEMGEELNYEVDTTSRYGNTHEENSGQD